MKYFIGSFLFLLLPGFKFSFAQKLTPGFDKQEFLELLKIGSRTTADSSWFGNVPAPESELIYQSEPVGFDNLWQLWRRKDGIPIISIRGTTKTETSFLANLYAAMVPATGVLNISNDFTFHYHLSDDPKAAVHIGFLISAAFLSKDIVSKIDSMYKKGNKEYIIAGHSQGGAISYLLTSYLENLKSFKTLPQDIRLKSCLSGAPKPGNLYYAYSFEQLTKNGWAYNVVNPLDWVPEVPFSIQTVNDLNTLNPFLNVKPLIKKQAFPKNLALNHAYKRLSKPSMRAAKNYRKYLGKMVSKMVKKKFPEFEPPAYYESNDYVRTGFTIVLTPNEGYFKKFPQTSSNVWINHAQSPYFFLMEEW